VSDFDHNGSNDVLWRNTSTGQVGAWLMSGTAVSGWAWMPTEPPSSGWQIQGIGDFTGDCNADVLWRNATTGQTGVWVMNGSAVVGWVWMPREPPDSHWQIQGVGDFTGDCRPDVLWRNTVTGQTGAWVMNGTAVVGWLWMPTEPPTSDWQIQGVGDFTGDCEAEVLWCNTVTGQCGTWLMVESAVAGWVWLPTEPPSSGWRIQAVLDLTGDGGRTCCGATPRRGRSEHG